ncbi:MAG: hypothetical protein Q9159_002422 [Coniocarpon cinnabarinum]
MQQIFANQSCDPFQIRSSRCIIGSYAVYTVNATTPEDVSRAIWFATYFNIRIVIKNTGHDYQGKSTGAGSLGIWVHHMKDISFLDTNGFGYHGSAYKAGAGVQTLEAFAAAEGAGFTVVGGECQSTSVAGGYTQGGGHSTLSSYFGLAADEVLEWEVVDGSGRLLTANPMVNSDLFWALSGGGGGTYGVVVSMTSKAHPRVSVTGANLTLAGPNISEDDVFQVFEVFLETLPGLVDAGAGMVWFLDTKSFTISPLTAPNVHPETLAELMKPITNKIDHLGIQSNFVVQAFNSFYEHNIAQQQPIPAGSVSLGGRFVPRHVVTDHKASYISTLRQIAQGGASITGVSLNVSTTSGIANTSINPAWRSTLTEQTVNLPYEFNASLETNRASQKAITNTYLPLLESITPGGGAYASEGDYAQQGWQDLFYGVNYEPLRRVKAVYDPYDVFYGLHNVGSEEWVQDDNGRLCRVCCTATSS